MSKNKTFSPVEAMQEAQDRNDKDFGITTPPMTKTIDQIVNAGFPMGGNKVFYDKEVLTDLLQQHEEQIREEEADDWYQSARVLWDRLKGWAKEWQAEEPKERKLISPDTLKLIEWKIEQEKEQERNRIQEWVKKNRGIADSAKYWVKLNDKLSHNQFVLRDKVGKDTITQIALEAIDAKLDDLLTQLNNKDI